MRRWLALLALIGAALLLQGAAVGCEDCDSWYEPSFDYEPPSFELDPPSFDGPAFDGPTYDPAPAYEPPAYEAPVFEPPVFEAPTYEPPAIAEVDAGPSSGPSFVAEIDPPVALERSEPVLTAADQAARLGAYLVTEIHAGDYAVTEGDTTRYGSTVVSQVPGTFARKTADVGTGEASALDALSTNGRMRLSDGRGVGGAYFETFQCDATGCVSLGYTFFADDSETKRRSTDPKITTPTRPAAVALPIPAEAPMSPILVATPSFLEPAAGRDGLDAERSAGPAPLPSGGVVPRDARAGVALGPQADVLGSIEVLRGRRVALWLRATVDGAPARVSAWRLVSGEVIALGPLGGTGDDPLVATWRSLAPRGGSFDLRFDVEVEVAGETPRRVPASISVAVRSPALVQ